eukprot:464103-Hanusia_phi.AAC.1
MNGDGEEGGVVFGPSDCHLIVPGKVLKCLEIRGWGQQSLGGLDAMASLGRGCEFGVGCFVEMLRSKK